MRRPCPRCGEKNPSEFNQCQRDRTGRQGYCRACNAAYLRDWYNRNRHRQRLRRAERHAVRRAQEAGVEIVPVSYAAILERDGFQCHFCGEPVERDTLSFDHVVPFARGGSHTPENVKVAHLSCNAAKSNYWALAA